MSLESKIEALTAAVVKLTEMMQANQQVAPVTVTPAQSIQEGKPVETPAPAAQPAAGLPPLPSFAAPPAQTAQVAPFTDAAGMIKWAMAKYQALGAEKGAQIQQVMLGLGYQNLNDVKPEHYNALYAGVEALK